LIIAISSLLLYTVINARNQPACVGAAHITPAEEQKKIFWNLFCFENNFFYVELVEVNVVSFQYDDKKLTLNYQDEQVQHKMDVKFVEQIYDYMKQHL